jgi:hypothetical protein
MLPIRLGMANADGDQDMIVYAFTRKGRVECTNYRTVPLPTGNNVPLFVKQDFGTFYGNLFQHQWEKEGKSVAMLEYAWNVTPQPNIMKCDPCVAVAPSASDLVQAGVWWLNGKDWNDYSDVDDDDEMYNSKDVYFTRLHVRYNRKNFAQDLNFMLTPNKENYQARYVITHPANGDFSCDAGKQYLKDLKKRRKKELQELTNLTGKNFQDWNMAYLDKEENDAIANSDASYAKAAAGIKNEDNGNPNGGLIFGAALLGLGALVYFKQRAFVQV